jgi:hypothetical protein
MLLLLSIRLTRLRRVADQDDACRNTFVQDQGGNQQDAQTANLLLQQQLANTQLQPARCTAAVVDVAASGTFHGHDA